MVDAPPPLLDTPPTPYKDRKTGLIIFGIGEMLLGGMAMLLIGLMFFGQIMMSRQTGQPLQLRLILPSAGIYAMLSIALITLGIGSVLARRWARALSLILAWAWLITGLVTLGAVVFVVPGVLRNAGAAGQGMPPQAMIVAMVAAVTTVGLFFVLVPGALVLFYRSRHVRATCEARDPHVRWTDACPLPVLGLALWLGITAAYMLLMPFFMNGAFPIFGVILSGWSGSLVCFLLAALWIYCAFALYQLEPAAWWVVLGSFALLSISAWISFSRISLPELYERMGYSQAQIQMMTQFSFLGTDNLRWMSTVAFIPLLGYLAWVKRFFRPAN